MASGKAHIRVKISTAAAEKRLLFLAREIPKELDDALKTLGHRAEFVFMAYAPKGKYSKGKIRDSIRATTGQDTSSAGSLGRRFSSARSVAITAEARSPKGYDYVGVSRFGHKVARIAPKNTGGRLLITGRHGWVGTFIGYPGQTIKAYHPPRDWAQDAADVMVQEAAFVSQALAKRLELKA